MEFSCSQASNVRFSRLLVTLLIVLYLLFGQTWALYLILVVSVSTILLGSKHNVSQSLLKLFYRLKVRFLTTIDEASAPSYTLNRSMELFEESMRAFMVSLLLVLDAFGFTTLSTLIAFMMMILMMISTFFRFCMSGVFYIIFQKLRGKA